MTETENPSDSGTLDRLAEILRVTDKRQSGKTIAHATSIKDLDSLATLDFLLSVEQAFGIDLDAQALYEANAFDTLQSLAEFIDNLRGNDTSLASSR